MADAEEGMDRRGRDFTGATAVGCRGLLDSRRRPPFAVAAYFKSTTGLYAGATRSVSAGVNVGRVVSIDPLSDGAREAAAAQQVGGGRARRREDGVMDAVARVCVCGGPVQLLAPVA